MTRHHLLSRSIPLLALGAHLAAAQPPATSASAPPRGVSKSAFGALPDGTPVDIYTLRNAHGLEARVITYGGIITSLRTPDRNGTLGDIVLGYDSLASYLHESPYFGAIVGRYANRIAKGRFTLDGKSYQVPINNGPNSLHGGERGFDKVVWRAASFDRPTGVGLVLTYLSPDGDQGYPGAVRARVTYTLTDKDELAVDYHATSDKATPINLSQHSYFNLTADARNNVLGHLLALDADRYTPVDSTLIPTGALASVEGTPFDFRTPTPIGARISANDEQLRRSGGYDHNFLLTRTTAGLSHAARVAEPTQGRTLDIYTTEPGIQFYSGNFLDGTLRGKSGVPYAFRTGFCLETQHFPDSPNKPAFPSTILRPGKTYSSRTVFAFGRVAADAQDSASHLATRWSAKVSAEHPWPEYPRPQMVRRAWTNLNGRWDYAITDSGAPKPAMFDGRIVVPFPVESQLSGVRRTVSETQRLWYRRTFRAPRHAQGERLLLHFGAVDWECDIYVNGAHVLTHRGGYDPFSADITDAIRASAPNGEQEIVVRVWDPTDAGDQPRGKQVRRPHSIWYTAVTGIWQTVWLETVPRAYVEALDVVPDLDSSLVRVTARIRGGTAGETIRVSALDGQRVVAEARGAVGEPVVLRLHSVKSWEPSKPFLYGLRIHLSSGDSVESYFGMRKIALMRDSTGTLRLALNNRPLFQLGLLDQGWWPDGLYTAPTDDALRFDIETTKQLGYNVARKHVKAEPDRWYYHADRLGLLVWQDMPSADNKTPEGRAEFARELEHMIDALQNHPSIVMWVPFNEGWGQHDTERYVAWLKGRDPSRPVNNASGWTDMHVGDVSDVHSYPGPSVPGPDSSRALVLGEFGGLGLPLAGHTWLNKSNWGYRSYSDLEQLGNSYRSVLQRVRPLIGEGLSAAIYTQTTDVEIEVNGVMTYDRAVVKLPKDAAALHAALLAPPPSLRVVLPTSRETQQVWRYTTTAPRADWMQPSFSDVGWSSGPAGFGSRAVENGRVRTPWTTPGLWIRRTFDVAGPLPARPHLVVHHDEDAEIYINGVRVDSLGGYTNAYTYVPLTSTAARALKEGTNVIAVHVRNTQGEQYIDVGITDVIEPPHHRH